jgi:hypothetical protein
MSGGAILAPFKQPEEARVDVAALEFVVDVLEDALSFSGLQGKKDGVDFGLHPVIALLGLGRADMKEQRKPRDCQLSWRNSDCQYSSVSRSMRTV